MKPEVIALPARSVGRKAGFSGAAGPMDLSLGSQELGGQQDQQGELL